LLSNAGFFQAQPVDNPVGWNTKMAALRRIKRFSTAHSNNAPMVMKPYLYVPLLQPTSGFCRTVGAHRKDFGCSKPAFDPDAG
jgi:hypothetical protein